VIKVPKFLVNTISLNIPSIGFKKPVITVPPRFEEVKAA
jgi:hypothetical protein